MRGDSRVKGEKKTSIFYNFLVFSACHQSVKCDLAHWDGEMHFVLYLNSVFSWLPVLLSLRQSLINKFGERERVCTTRVL